MLRRDTRPFAQHFRKALELHQAGRLTDAVAAYERAIAANATVADAHNNLACAFMALGRLVEAATALERALALRPEYATALDNLGLVRGQLGDRQAAVELLTRAAALEPASGAIQVHLGNALLALQRCAAALRAFEAAIRLMPGDAAAYNGLGAALERLARNDEAEAAFRTALAADPRFAEAAGNLGCTLLNAGDVFAARGWFERALALAPVHPQFHFYLGLVRAGPVEPERLAAMERLTENLGAYPPEQRVYLHFALAAAYDTLDRCDDAFAHLLAGNALKRATIPYDEDATLHSAGVLAAALNEGFVAGLRGCGHASSRPIFVFGMPRSGTTLVEQLLAAQTGVTAAGEVSAFGELAGEFGRTIAAGLSLPDLQREIATLAERYLAATDGLAGAGAWVTDKMPGNVWYAPLIHLAFPNARMIHVRRDRLDTCVSCFATLFVDQAVPYAYDLGELGRYYRAYERAVANWRSFLPADRFLEVDYERLVDDFGAQARRIVAFCGLPWDEAAPPFHAVHRTVRTASAAQVRRPLYRSAVGRSARFAAHLGALLAALDGEPAPAVRTGGAA